MPYAQNHYPFENKDIIEGGGGFPGDFISEGIDQTRGWFYTLLVLATHLFNKAPMKNVIVTGLVMAAFVSSISSESRLVSRALTFSCFLQRRQENVQERKELPGSQRDPREVRRGRAQVCGSPRFSPRPSPASLTLLYLQALPGQLTHRPGRQPQLQGGWRQARPLARPPSLAQFVQLLRLSRSDPQEGDRPRLRLRPRGQALDQLHGPVGPRAMPVAHRHCPGGDDRSAHPVPLSLFL